MTTRDIISHRLINQQIAKTKFKKPHEIVSWMAAMQAQEFAMAKWAIGLRLPGLIDADVEKAFNEGSILRTHLLRPTWHFVTPADICWLLALTAPRVNAVNAYWYRKFELDNKIFKRSNNTIVKTLRGGKQLTRTALKSALEQVKIRASGLRLSYLMMRAELDGIICSGAREGKQFTYALLEERVPPFGTLKHDEALAELTKRYFLSRGPVTLQDFVYWSGLTMKEAKEGASTLTSFEHVTINGHEYIFEPDESKSIDNIHSRKSVFPLTGLQTTFLMPDYDEYGISYKNRSALTMGPPLTHPPTTESGTSIVKKSIEAYSHLIVVDGMIGGTWQRTIKNNTIDVITDLALISKTKGQEVRNAVKRYISFFGNLYDQ